MIMCSGNNEQLQIKKLQEREDDLKGMYQKDDDYIFSLSSQQALVIATACFENYVGSALCLSTFMTMAWFRQLENL